MWFVEIIDTGDNYVTRYIPVRANSMAEASAAARATGLESWERIGTIASRLHFEGQGVQNLPPDSAAITAVAGDNGGNGISNISNVSDEPGGVSEAFDFGPGFEAGLGRLGINIGGGGGVQGAVARRQFDPLASRFFAQEAFREGGDPTGAGAGTSFQRFLANQGAAGTLFGGAGSLASRNLLNQARGFTDFREASLPSPLAGGVLNPATTTEGMRLANIARDAGRQRFGSLARFLPGAGDLSQSYLAQDQPSRSSFADYLNQRIFGV